MFKKSYKKILSGLLTASLLTLFWGQTTANALNIEFSFSIDGATISYLENDKEVDDYEINDNEIVLTSDDTEYTVSESYRGDDRIVRLTYDDKIIEYSFGDDTICSDIYETTETYSGATIIKKVESHEESTTEYATNNNPVNGQYTWSSKANTPAFGEKIYYYRFGKSNYGNTYYQVGSYKKVSEKTNYNVPYYKLSSSGKSQVNLYKKYVKDSMDLYTIGAASCNASTWGMIVAAIIVSGASLEVPIAAVITAVVVICGGYTASVTYGVKSYYAKLNAIKQYPDTIALGFKAPYN